MGDLFKALSDRTRRAILDKLTNRDGQTLFEICGRRLISQHGVTATRQAISQHLDVLESAGFVRTEGSGRYKFHYIDTSPPREIRGAMATQWRGCRRSKLYLVRR